MNQSVRSQVIARRTYNRPKNAEGTEFETWDETINRVIGHQQWLWERAKGSALTAEQEKELEELRGLMLRRESLVAGRTLWLGGTEVAKRRESSQFNCSFARVNTVHDVVSGFWLLLQGCLPPDTPVLTADGPKPIKDITVGEYVWSYNKTDDTQELKKVTKTHNVIVEKEDNIKIGCRHGEFTTSRKHPVLVNRDGVWQYVPAGVVKLGDIVRKAVFKSPETFSFNEKAWFVGAFHGDGCSNMVSTNSRRIRFTKDCEETTAAFARAISHLSGVDTKYKVGNRPEYNVPMWHIEKTLYADTPLVNDWDNIVGILPNKKTYSIEPPAWIRSSYDPEVFFSYLAGLLDTDGFVSEQKATISTSSKPLVDALVALCPIYGIYPWTSVTEPEDYNSSGYTPLAPMYRVTFSVYDVRHCVVSMRSPAKRGKLQAALDSARNRRRQLVIPEHKVAEEAEYLELSPYTVWHFNHRLATSGYCHSGYYVSRDKSYDHLLQYDEVINIETELDIDTNFKDLTVEDNHSYLCGFGSYYTLHNCGVGFEPVPGTLNGFAKPLEVEIVRSTMTMEEWDAGERGEEHNYESYYVDDNHKKVWRIQVGDSAEAWCKAAGKVLAGKRRVDKLVLDLTQIRPGGIRLKGYGWISSGDVTLAEALKNIAGILNRRADQLLTRIDILDVMNWLGTTLSSRRSAEIALVPFNDPEWEAFALAKKDSWKTGNVQRAQSNNSLIFNQKPTKLELRAIFDMIKEGGGSEPGFINGEAAKKRAPWFAGLNPCAK